MVLLPVLINRAFGLVEMVCTPVLSTPAVCRATDSLMSLLALVVVEAS
jgi:hypothetical protein